ncbi:subtilisin-like protein [Ascobolus immersus RN42]|uniref:Subtilisin-like protein n=1 Tax=Ascobolus immersus RN42 TaxID=1160509 RepID=A0A3N4HBR7_ASCIM|nr:subtilisin-like protein [Ascobolus immersus RN42]
MILSALGFALRFITTLLLFMLLNSYTFKIVARMSLSITRGGFFQNFSHPTLFLSNAALLFLCSLIPFLWCFPSGFYANDLVKPAFGLCPLFRNIIHSCSERLDEQLFGLSISAVHPGFLVISQAMQWFSILECSCFLDRLSFFDKPDAVCGSFSTVLLFFTCFDTHGWQFRLAQLLDTVVKFSALLANVLFGEMLKFGSSGMGISSRTLRKFRKGGCRMISLSVFLCLVGTASAQPPVASHPSPFDVSTLPSMKGNYWDRLNGITGVSTLHREGFAGQQTVIAILDRDLHLQHTALGGGCFGAGTPDCKVVDAISFIETQAEGSFPQASPDIESHGTMAASAALGNDNFIRSPAFLARLFAVQTRPNEAQSQTNSPVKLFKQAMSKVVERAIRIACISTGEHKDVGAFTQNPNAKAVDSYAKDHPILLTVAAGNEGWYGGATVQSYGANEFGLTVGNFAPEFVPAFGFTAYMYSTSFHMLYTHGGMLKAPASLRLQLRVDEFYLCGIDRSLRTYLSDMMLLVWVGGECDGMTAAQFEGLISGILEAGAAGVFLVGNVFPDLKYLAHIGDGNKVVGYLHGMDADYILGAAQEGEPITVSFPALNDYKLSTVRNTWEPQQAGGVNMHSSLGPSYDLHNPIDVLAPGTFSFLATKGTSGYKYDDGTSIAAPTLAGMIGACISKRGGDAVMKHDDLQALRDIVATTAEPVNALRFPWESLEDFPEGSLDLIIRQGSGVAQIDKACQSPLLVRPTKLHLLDIENFVPDHDITVTNNGLLSLEVVVTERPALGMYLMNSDKKSMAKWEDFPHRSAALKATVTIAVSKALIAPGASHTFSVKFSYPRGFDVGRWPSFGGLIEVTANKEFVHRVQYSGSAGKHRSIQVMPEVPTLMLSPNGPTIHGSVTLGSEISGERRALLLSVILSVGSEEVRVDYVEEDYLHDLHWSYPPIDDQNKFLGAAPDGVKLYVQRYIPDETNKAFENLKLDGKTSSGKELYFTSISCRIRVVALRNLGDKSVAEDWDVWTSEVITFEV